MIAIKPKHAHIPKGGSIKDLQRNLKKIASNAAVTQLCAQLKTGLSYLSCEAHPDATGNMIEVSIPGGDVTKAERFNFAFTGFCCVQFQEQAKEQLYSQFQDESDNSESA